MIGSVDQNHLTAGAANFVEPDGQPLDPLEHLARRQGVMGIGGINPQRLVRYMLTRGEEVSQQVCFWDVEGRKGRGDRHDGRQR